MNKKLTNSVMALLILLVLPQAMTAEKFKVGNLYYETTGANAVAVVPQYDDYWDDNEKPTGILDIPVAVDYNGKNYNVTTIGKYAFFDCTSLTKVIIPVSITKIEEQALVGCLELTSIEVASGNNQYSSVEGVLFNKNKTTLIQYPIGSSRTNYTTPSSVTKIDYAAFYNSTNLKEVNISSSVTAIGEGALGECFKLEKIKVAPENSQYCSVEGVVFNKNKTTLIQYPIGNSRTSYTIPGSVEVIGVVAFASCSNLMEVTIPGSVTKIGEYAFFNCENFKNIFNKALDPATITMGDNVFDFVSTNSCTLWVPKDTKSKYEAAAQWKEFANIKEEGTGLSNTNTLTVKLYPNPASEKLNIQTDEQIVSIEVYDTEGKRIFSTDRETQQIDLTGWAEGTYFVRMNTAERTQTFKIVKKR